MWIPACSECVLFDAAGVCSFGGGAGASAEVSTVSCFDDKTDIHIELAMDGALTEMTSSSSSSLDELSLLLPSSRLSTATSEISEPAGKRGDETER